MKTRKKTDKEKKADDQAADNAFRELSMASIRFVTEFRDLEGDVSFAGWSPASGALQLFESKERQQRCHLVGDAGDQEKGITSHYMYGDDV